MKDSAAWICLNGGPDMSHDRPTTPAPGAGPRPLPDWENLGFGFVETDAFYRCHGRLGDGPVWREGEFLPFGPVSLSPAASFLSYGLGVFEGMRVQRAADGRVLLFRHRDNARRFQRSAERLLMPEFPEDRFVAGVEGVVQRNLRFVPPHRKGSLYVRPMEHAIEPKLGIAPCSEFWVLIYGCPVGNYFASTGGSDKESLGLRLKVVEQARCATDGTGAAKAMGNYAGGIAVAQRWKKAGFHDVLYLDAEQLTDLTETSGSNVFVKLGNGTLVTPSLNDQILAGITRDSAIRVARDVLGVTVEERPISVDEALEDGEEIFCTGTAWTVRSIGEIDYLGRLHRFASSELQQAILDEIQGIQLGEREDRFGWISEVRS